MGEGGEGYCRKLGPAAKYGDGIWERVVPVMGLGRQFRKRYMGVMSE